MSCQNSDGYLADTNEKNAQKWSHLMYDMSQPEHFSINEFLASEIVKKSKQIEMKVINFIITCSCFTCYSPGECESGLHYCML